VFRTRGDGRVLDSHVVRRGGNEGFTDHVVRRGGDEKGSSDYMVRKISSQ
jgi:hypothetical protein